MCIAAAHSTNLERLERPRARSHWAVPRGLAGQCSKSSCVHPIGERFVLFYTHAGGTRYVYFRQPDAVSNDEGTMLIEGLLGACRAGQEAGRSVADAIFKAQTATRRRQALGGISRLGRIQTHVFNLAQVTEISAAFVESK